MPRELDKVVMPQYVIEPPDILTIQLLDAVPKAPYRLKTLDLITVQVAGTLPDAPIAGIYPIEPGGLVNLGAPYGGVAVAGMSTEEAQAAISAHLKTFLREPEVSVALAELSAAQQLVGEEGVTGGRQPAPGRLAAKAAGDLLAAGRNSARENCGYFLRGSPRQRANLIAQHPPVDDRPAILDACESGRQHQPRSAASRFNW